MSSRGWKPSVYLSYCDSGSLSTVVEPAEGSARHCATSFRYQPVGIDWQRLTWEAPDGKQPSVVRGWTDFRQ